MRIPRRPPSFNDLFGRRSHDLNTAVIKHEFNDFTRRCEAGYWPWDKVRMAARSSGVDAELAWLMVKIGRMQRFRSLPLFGTGGYALRFNVPDRVQHELMLIDQQMAGRLLSDEADPLTQHQRERFIISALREEAIASSMLEGAATTRRDAKSLLRSGRKPRTRAERMVVNNYHAIMFIREHRKTPLSVDFTLELQSILTRGTLDREDEVGRFRTDRDDISIVDHRDNEVMHTPPAASELEERLDAFCRFANETPTSGAFIHPVIKACVLHFQIGFDHPFCDGNGRTARALFYWAMLKNDYWLFEFLPISRLIYRSPAKYTKAYLLCETDDFDVTYFLSYKVKIISRARQELREYLQDQQVRQSEARKTLAGDERLNHRQREVVLRASRNPERVLTIADHQSRFAVSYGTARTDLLELSRWGYLTYSADTKRYDFYASDKVRNAEW